MSQFTRRGLIAGGSAAAAIALTPQFAHAAGPSRPTPVPFTLQAEVLDGGEEVVALSLDLTGYGAIDPASLTAGTFAIHAKAVSPVPIAAGEMIFNTYDGARAVTSARFASRTAVLRLASGPGTSGGATLGYLLRAGRNVRLLLTYTITQVLPLRTVAGQELWLPGFAQGALVNPEVDAYASRVSGTRMNYRLYAPAKAKKQDPRPLIVWLHGGGEGGSAALGYYDNETQLRANRGALGFSTPAAQAIFGGAYVVAPQAESYWLENGPLYAPRVKALIDELVAMYPIDVKRIHVVGCSNGGYMSLEMTSMYPSAFASSVPICGVLNFSPVSSITDAELAAITTPTWLVASRNDPVVPYAANTGHAAEMIPGARLTAYDTVTWNGATYNGHWSWIYVARNAPKQQGQTIWEWMAAQQRG